MEIPEDFVLDNILYNLTCIISVLTNIKTNQKLTAFNVEILKDSALKDLRGLKKDVT